MGAQIDTARAHLVREHGDIAAVYTWVNDERALVLVCHRRPGSPWYVVMESAAFKYDDPHYLARQCAKACEVLGIEPSRPNWVRVATIIHEGLPDLITMPAFEQRPVPGVRHGELKLFADKKHVASEDIVVPLREAPRYG